MTEDDREAALAIEHRLTRLETWMKINTALIVGAGATSLVNLL